MVRFLKILDFLAFLVEILTLGLLLGLSKWCVAAILHIPLVPGP